MNYKYFRFDFRTFFRRKPLAVVAGCNRATGFMMTVYLNNTPVFNLLSDRYAEVPSPIEHDHEWGVVRWTVSR